MWGGGGGGGGGLANTFAANRQYLRAKRVGGGVNRSMVFVCVCVWGGGGGAAKGNGPWEGKGVMRVVGEAGAEGK